MIDFKDTLRTILKISFKILKVIIAFIVFSNAIIILSSILGISSFNDLPKLFNSSKIKYDHLLIFISKTMLCWLTLCISLQKSTRFKFNDEILNMDTYRLIKTTNENYNLDFSNPFLYKTKTIQLLN